MNLRSSYAGSQKTRPGEVSMYKESNISQIKEEENLVGEKSSLKERKEKRRTKEASKIEWRIYKSPKQCEELESLQKECPKNNKNMKNITKAWRSCRQLSNDDIYSAKINNLL